MSIRMCIQALPEPVVHRESITENIYSHGNVNVVSRPFKGVGGVIASMRNLFSLNANCSKALL